MEFGWALRQPMRLPDSPRHERGLPAALQGVGVKPEVCSRKIGICSCGARENFGCPFKWDLPNQMADHPPNHRGEGMDDFVAELARMTLVVGYPNAPEYSTVPPLSGEFPHRVRLEVHGYVHTCLANMVVEASGGTADHACQEAAYLMMARLRERHNYIFCNTAYRFHPRQASGDDVSTFRSTAGENDTTFGHMCAVMRGMDRMHSDLRKASRALNDGKLVRIIALKDEIARLKKDEIARLKKENAQLKNPQHAPQVDDGTRAHSACAQEPTSARSSRSSCSSSSSPSSCPSVSSRVRSLLRSSISRQGSSQWQRGLVACYSQWQPRPQQQQFQWLGAGQRRDVSAKLQEPLRGTW
uniref:Retrotransposon protein, putative, Ty3-gypsy subclass, expressed n=1 Tax=Oryza sativa subsp. japonica TaxID=39947 RepID=Q2QWQ1_ORYSJ|nr:retrotransposon protein, putative, Ty3-gypsy subclass, expressed [Oryza sativa Japonica Group]